jgi:hypothetical protein
MPAPLPAMPTPGRPYRPALAHEVMPRACHECGKALDRITRALPDGRPASDRGWRTSRKFCSASCAAIYRAEMRRVAPLAERSGEIAAIRAIETARSDKLRRHAKGRRAWVGTSGGDEAALRKWYIAEVVPRLGAIERTKIARTLGVSRVYARDLALGKVPHPRHFAALAALANMKIPEGWVINAVKNGSVL